MTDYIKREDAVEKLRHLRDKCGNEEMAFALNWGASLVQKMFGADVRKNKHGEWIDDIVAFHHVCSICRCCVRATMMEVFEGEGEWNYCPNCGAQMNGGDDE